MTDCNCDICIGREDIEGEKVCSYVENKKKEDVIPIFIRKLDGSEPIAKEVKALYKRVHKEYGN